MKSLPKKESLLILYTDGGDLHRLRNRVAVEWEHGRENLYAKAAIHDDGKRASALIVNFGPGERTVRLLPEQLPFPGGWVAELYMLDETKTMEPVASTSADGAIECRLGLRCAQLKLLRA